MILIQPSSAVDIVTYTSGQDGKKQSKAHGEIIDYTGKSLTIVLAGDREQLIPTERVVEIKSAWTPQQTEGDKKYAEGKFDEALQQYEDSVRIEHRVWAKRLILSKHVWCLRATKKYELAAEKFLLIVGNDSTTQYFDCIPLAWKTQQPDAGFQRQAIKWLDAQDDAVTTLMGASWLLSTTHRPAALDALAQLGNDPDPRIAHLADAQRWRTEIVTAKPDEVGRWQKQIDRMPKSLRAGPHFIVAQALARQGQHELSAMTFMRTAIFFPNDRQLVAGSLHLAATELEQLGRTSEAVGLYREVANVYADVAVAAEATGRLESLTKANDE